jgi:subtilase family serine protease
MRASSIVQCGMAVGSAILLALAPAATAQVKRPLITETVDEGSRVVLKGNTRAEVRPELGFDRGAVPDSMPLPGIQILLKRAPEVEDAIQRLSAEQLQPGSANFHNWLVPEEFAQQFGAADEDIAAVGAWLTSHGFVLSPPSANRMTITFSGPAGLVREAFHTEIHALDVKGTAHIANVQDPSIPAALAPAIAGIVRLHDFKPKAAHVMPTPGVVASAGAAQDVGPADLAAIYNFTPVHRSGVLGQGRTIMVVNDSDLYSVADWQRFRTVFGLDRFGGTLAITHPGGCPDPGINFDDVEATLDIEWAAAAAPAARIEAASCPYSATSDGDLFAIQSRIVERPLPDVITYSYSYCESGNGATLNAAYSEAFLQATLEGISVYISAGDQGAANCDFITPAQYGIAVNAYAGTPYNVSVGGTDFADTDLGTTSKFWAPRDGVNFRSARGYVPEIAWNDTCASALLAGFNGFEATYGATGFCQSVAGSNYLYLAAGSGGPSNCWTGVPNLSGSDGTCAPLAKPWWQNAPGNPHDGVRDQPDVAFFAGPGIWHHAYIFCFTDPSNSYSGSCAGSPATWPTVGGTSTASPILAGVQVLVNQVWGRQGNPNPVFYLLGRTQYASAASRNACNSTDGPAAWCVFNDVTLGDNDTDCIGPYNCFGNNPNDPTSIGVLSLVDTAFEPAYKARPGWDFATGLGSINVGNLVFNPIWAGK